MARSRWYADQNRPMNLDLVQDVRTGRLAVVWLDTAQGLWHEDDLHCRVRYVIASQTVVWRDYQRTHYKVGPRHMFDPSRFVLVRRGVDTTYPPPGMRELH